MEKIAGLAQLAAVLEASCEKPGNVTPTRSFSDTTYSDYLLSAAAFREGLEEAARRGFDAGKKGLSLSELGLGSLIKKCVLDARKKGVSGNPHLGTLMFFVPLSSAAGLCLAQDVSFKKALRVNLRRVVDASTVADSQNFYEAVESAGTGGLAGDLEKPSVPFCELMRVSAPVDRVAEELSTGLEIVFKKAVPEFNRVCNQLGDPLAAATQTFLSLLSQFPDSLIAKKVGLEKSREVSSQAHAVLRVGGVFTGEGFTALEEFDAYLRSEGNQLNPGATADLTAAACFVWLLRKSF